MQYNQHVSEALCIEVVPATGLTAVQRADARLRNHRTMGNIAMLVPAHANQNLTARIGLLYELLTRFQAACIMRVDTPALSSTTTTHVTECLEETIEPQEEHATRTT